MYDGYPLTSTRDKISRKTPAISTFPLSNYNAIFVKTHWLRIDMSLLRDIRIARHADTQITLKKSSRKKYYALLQNYI